jgi:hypothetical protein
VSFEEPQPTQRNTVRIEARRGKRMRSRYHGES